MLGLSLYGDALYILVACIFFFGLARVVVRDGKLILVNRVVELFFVFLIIAVVSYDISLRPGDMEGDTAVYINFFNDLNAGLENPFQTFEPGFIELVKLFGYLSLGYQDLFYVITFSFLWSYYVLAREILGRKSLWPLFVFGVVLFYPFFFSLTANIIRQGFSLCLVNFALYFFVKGVNKRGGLLVLLAVLFHKSSVIFFPIVLLRSWILKFNVFGVICLWFVVSLLSYVKFFGLLTILLFDFLSGYGLVVNYTDVDGIDYVTGFRWDFWLFSSFSVFLLCTLKLLGENLYKTEAYIFFVCALLSCLHIAMLDVAYNDRFGIYSWIFYPIEIAYVIRSVGENFASGNRRNNAQRSILAKQGEAEC